MLEMRLAVHVGASLCFSRGVGGGGGGLRIYCFFLATLNPKPSNPKLGSGLGLLNFL